MRILMISDVYFPRINGVSTSIRTFRNELRKLGHTVFLVVPEYDGAEPEEEGVFRIRSRRVVMDAEDRMMRLRDIVALIPRLRELNVHLVHIHTPFVAHYAGVRIATALQVKSVATYHTLFEEYLHHYVRGIPRPLLRLLARRVSASQCNAVAGVVAPSSVIVELLRRYGVRKEPCVIPTGIDWSHFAEGNGAPIRARLGLPEHTRLLLNVSRIAYEKNIDLLLRVFRRLLEKMPDVHLVIAGDGPAKKRYVELVREWGLERHVSFLGYLDRETELVNCYHSADLFVFASRTETQGLVLLEAMAAGVPVVALSAMGTRDVLREGEGALITTGSVEDFRDKILLLLQDPDRHRELVVSARRWARQWDCSQLARKLAGFYLEVSRGPVSAKSAARKA